MINVGLIGFGFMGRMHVDNYERLEKEGHPVKLVAICDVQMEAIKHAAAGGNMKTEKDVYDLQAYSLYESIEEMLKNEELDLIDITIPTPYHADMTIKLLQDGYHVLCEKPAARHSLDAKRMAKAASQAKGKLLVGQCLRFWPCYQFLKEAVDSGQYGQVNGAYFFRGSGHPGGWFLDGALSGGNLLDMHIHDTDMVSWLFGAPEKVSTVGKNVRSSHEAFDIVSTHYSFLDGKVVNAQSDWTLEGDFGFEMSFRVSFEKANIVLNNNIVTVNLNSGGSFNPQLSENTGYYNEILYFIQTILSESTVEHSHIDSSVETLTIIEAEEQSAILKGEWISIHQ